MEEKKAADPAMAGVQQLHSHRMQDGEIIDIPDVVELPSINPDKLIGDWLKRGIFINSSKGSGENTIFRLEAISD